MNEKIRRIGHYAKAYYSNRDSINRYQRGVRSVNARKSQTKTIVFLINFPESWNSVKSVYEEAVAQNDLNVFIVAVPRKVEEGQYEKSEIGSMQNAAYEFFCENGIDSIKANLENNEWFDLKELNPDYVIYTRPYNEFYPEPYQSANTCIFAKCIYIPYAYGMLGSDALFTVLPENFIFTTRKVYFANESRMLESKMKIPRYGRLARDRFVHEGFPRFDLYASSVNCLKGESNKKFTIAWMPRWTTDNLNSKQKASHFLAYYDEFLKYAERQQNIEIIIRPHPNMFPTYLSNGVMTEEEINNFYSRCEAAGNVRIDTCTNYMNTLLEADVLVADYTSLIAEFFITGKPIIFCDSLDGLNEEGLMICGAAYFAEEFCEIEKHINNLMNGNDEKLSVRKGLIDELLPNKIGQIGKNVLQSIIKC